MNTPKDTALKPSTVATIDALLATYHAVGQVPSLGELAASELCSVATLHKYKALAHVRTVTRNMYGGGAGKGWTKPALFFVPLDYTDDMGARRYAFVYEPSTAPIKPVPVPVVELVPEPVALPKAVRGAHPTGVAVPLSASVPVAHISPQGGRVHRLLARPAPAHKHAEPSQAYGSSSPYIAGTPTGSGKFALSQREVGLGMRFVKYEPQPHVCVRTGQVFNV